MGRLLHEWGYRPLLFDDGESALRGLDAIRVEAVILDQEMPKLSGVELAAMLRDKWNGDSPALLLVTGNPGQVGEPQRVLFDGIYAKPFAPAELALALATSIRARSDGPVRWPPLPK
jgi:DNA-binding response OmpR family regulator